VNPLHCIAQVADDGSTVIPAAFVGLFVYGVIWPIFVYFWDPKNLRRFPAPSLWGIPAFAGWSNAWLGAVIAKYARSAHVQAAHDQYGNVVRIQPNHISFIEPSAAKDIYGFQSKMLKDDFYETFAAPDREGHTFKSIVNTPDREEHSRKRKYISHAFAQRTVVNLDPLVNRGVASLVKQFDKIAVSGPPKWPGAPRDGFTNLYRWINILAYDIVGEISFGECLGLCEQGNDVMEALPFDGSAPYKTNIIDAFQGGNIYDCFFGPFPYMVNTLKRLTSWHHNSIKNKAFGEFVNMEVHKRLKRGGPSGFRDFMSYFLEDGKGEKLNLEYGEQWREASILLAGGTDTSTSSMTSTIYLLLKNPRCLQRLREEIDPVLTDTKVASYDQVCNLPYLRAVIEEALRDRPPVGQGLPRVVPEGGATIAGHFIQGKLDRSVPHLTSCFILISSLQVAPPSPFLLSLSTTTRPFSPNRTSSALSAGSRPTRRIYVTTVSPSLSVPAHALDVTSFTWRVLLSSQPLFTAMISSFRARIGR
jgi:cytochrome P450